MASFITILKKVGSVLLGVEHLAAPIAEIAFPQFAGAIAEVDSLTGRLQNAITTVEANSPVGTDGSLKSAAVIADFNAAIGLAQSVAGFAGKQISYDAGALQAAINAQVNAYNAAAALKASFHMVDIVPAKA